jgi:hypothetical protein
LDDLTESELNTNLTPPSFKNNRKVFSEIYSAKAVTTKAETLLAIVSKEVLANE